MIIANILVCFVLYISILVHFKIVKSYPHNVHESLIQVTYIQSEFRKKGNHVGT